MHAPILCQLKATKKILILPFLGPVWSVQGSFCSWLVFNAQAADDICVVKKERRDDSHRRHTRKEVVGAECSVCDHFRLLWFCCSSWCSAHQQPWLDIFICSILHPFLVTAKARKTKELIPSSVQHVTTPGSAREQKGMENQDIWRLFSYITPGIHTLPDQASCLWKQTFIHFPRTLQKCLSTISVWLRV